MWFCYLKLLVSSFHITWNSHVCMLAVNWISSSWSRELERTSSIQKKFQNNCRFHFENFHCWKMYDYLITQSVQRAALPEASFSIGSHCIACLKKSQFDTSSKSWSYKREHKRKFVELTFSIYLRTLSYRGNEDSKEENKSTSMKTSIMV